MSKKLSKFLSLLLCLCFLFEQSGFAQVAGQLDISGHLAQLRNSLAPDKFRPLHLRFLSYDNLNNNFKLLLDKGDLKHLKTPELENSTKTLLNYFFIGITLPNDRFWVNLRPDLAEQIIDDALAKTDVGKILLEADLQLKKDTAQFTSPETPEGKDYWDKLYKKAGELFSAEGGSTYGGGSQNITIPTLTRPWIVPDEIIIRETDSNAYIYKATLKVMLEEDYLVGRGHLNVPYNFNDPRLRTLNEYSSQLIRALIIPKLIKEVNTAKRYAALRQVYYSLILAQWFKARFYGKGGLYSWLIDKKNLNGLTSQAPWSKTTYFKEYQRSFKEGEYNLKVPISTPFGQTIRSYMSGGIMLGLEGENAIQALPASPGQIAGGGSSPIIIGGNPGKMPVVKNKLDRLWAVDIDGSNNAADVTDVVLHPDLGEVTEVTSALKETSSPPTETSKSGASSPIEERTPYPFRKEGEIIKQEELPDVYWKIIAPYALRMVDEALRTRTIVQNGEMDAKERRHLLDGIFKEAIEGLLNKLFAVAKSADEKIKLIATREMLAKRDVSQHMAYALAMATWIGQEMVQNGNGEYTNVFIPRDSGLWYVADLVLGMLSGQPRSAKLLYISGSNATFGAYYGQTKEAIRKLDRQSRSQPELITKIRREYIEPRMSHDSGFKDKIETIMTDMRRLGITNLSKVRFVDSGFLTFPLLFAAILQMINPEIEVWAVVQEKEAGINNLPQLNRGNWLSRIKRWIERTKANLFAVPQLHKSEQADGFLRHPFAAGKDGVMRAQALHLQLESFWLQLVFARAAIIYDDALHGLIAELVEEGKSLEEAKKIAADMFNKLSPLTLPQDWQTISKETANLHNIHIQTAEKFFITMVPQSKFANFVINPGGADPGSPFGAFIKPAPPTPLINFTPIKIEQLKFIKFSRTIDISTILVMLMSISTFHTFAVSPALTDIFNLTPSYLLTAIAINAVFALAMVVDGIVEYIRGKESVINIPLSWEYKVKNILADIGNSLLFGFTSLTEPMSYTTLFTQGLIGLFGNKKPNNNPPASSPGAEQKPPTASSPLANAKEQGAASPVGEVTRRDFLKSMVGVAVATFVPDEAVAAVMKILGITSDVISEEEAKDIKTALEKLEPWEVELFKLYGLTIRGIECDLSNATMRKIELLSPIIESVSGLGTVIHEAGHILTWLIAYTEHPSSWVNAVLDIALERAFEDSGPVGPMPDRLKLSPGLPYLYTEDGNNKDLRGIIKQILAEMGKTEVEFDTYWKDWQEKKKDTFEYKWQDINNRNKLTYESLFDYILRFLKIRKKGFVSPYASTNRIEDIAETYRLLRDDPKQLDKLVEENPIAEKVALLKEYLGRLEEFYNTDAGKRTIKTISLPAVSSSSSVPEMPKTASSPLAEADERGASSLLADQTDTLGKCVTADTLLSLADGRQVPIVEVKPGDYVLSLNEETQQTEPHRIKGLLDMGVKPVYKLSTSSGRSIKTTANHPYLTQMGWQKIGKLKIGEQIAVTADQKGMYSARNSNSSSWSGKTRKSLLVKSSGDALLVRSRSKAAFIWLISLGSILRRIIPGWSTSGGWTAKSLSCVTSTAFSEMAKLKTSPLDRPFGEMTTSCPRPVRNDKSPRCTFSSSKKRISLFQESRIEFADLQDSSGVMQGCLHMLRCQFRVGFLDFLQRGVSLKHLENQIYHDARPFKTGLPVADIGISGNVIFNSHISSPFSYQLYHSLIRLSRFFAPEVVFAQPVLEKDILWDKITSIEPVGLEHVYDIEVEGTHNFIGNGIFAHNTYIDAQHSASSAIIENRLGESVEAISKLMGEVESGFLMREGLPSEIVRALNQIFELEKEPPIAGKNPAELLRDIVFDTDELSLKQHIETFNTQHSKSLERLRVLKGLREELGKKGIDVKQAELNRVLERIELLVSKKPSASSPLAEPVTSDKGGIDLRALPIVTELISERAPLVGQVRPLSGRVPVASLDAEWRQIENMLQAGITPSNQRIKEYLQVSCQSEDCSQRIDKVLSLLADILRLEEERVSSTEPALREFLVLLESDKSAQELQSALSKITVLPKEPKTIEE